MIKYKAGPPGEWLHPDDHEPPKGTSIRMLTKYGRDITGTWCPGMAAWMPHPKLTEEMEKRLWAEGRLK